MHPKMMRGCLEQQIYAVTEEEYEKARNALRYHLYRATASAKLPCGHSVLSQVNEQAAFLFRLADEILAEAGVTVADDPFDAEGVEPEPYVGPWGAG